MRRLFRTLPLIAATFVLGVASVHAQSLLRLTVAVSGGYQPTTTVFNDSFEFTVNRETGRSNTTYGVDAGSLFDGGFGVRLWRRLGAGLAISSFRGDGSVNATSSVPHPLLFEHHREVSGDAGGSRREETGVHIQAQYLLPSFGKLQVTVMGGPSILDIKQTVATRVKYTEQYPYDTAAFAGVDVRKVTGTKTGFNAGADARWMFTRYLGAGAVVRYTHAPIELRIDDRTIDVDAGGAQVGAGLRIVF